MADMNRRQFLAATGGLGMGATMSGLQAVGAPPAETQPALFSGRAYPPAADHPALRERSQKQRAQDSRPNILFVFTDQQTIGALSCAGNSWVSTPNLDALAARGVRFTRSYCTSPVCSPARSSLITSRMPHETGVVYNDRLAVDPAIPNLGQIFQAAGYDTTWSGKWHLPESYLPAGKTMPGFVHLPLTLSKPAGSGDETDALYALDATYYLNWHAGLSAKPWLYVVSLHNPHDICMFTGLPLLPAQNVDHCPPLPANFAMDPQEPEFYAQRRTATKYGGELPRTRQWTEAQWRTYLQTYYQLTQTVDRAIGRIFQALETGGWLDNTLVVFSSDHGEGVAAHHWMTKLSLYEEVVSVPFIIAYPQHIPAGQVDTHHLVSGLDLLPTLCDYAGIKNPPSFRGRSLRPVLENPQAPWRDYVVTELADEPKQPERQGRMVATERYKYNVFAVGARNEQLFDLASDPGETRNLAGDAAQAPVLAEMRQRLGQWIKETNDPFVMPTKG